jgi:choline kinase
MIIPHKNPSPNDDTRRRKDGQKVVIGKDEEDANAEETGTASLETDSEKYLGEQQYITKVENNVAYVEVVVSIL